MLPHYSASALFGKSFLFRKFNDIDIFIEDSSNRVLMEGLIARILEGRARITSIHQLGGKAAVIERCANDQADSRRRLYIIDGDLDLLTGEAAPKLNYFYRLNVYCAENLLLCNEALVKVAYEDATNKARNLVESEVDSDGLLKEIEKKLLYLFVTYAVAHKLNCGIETVRYSIFKLLDGLQLDKKLIASRCIQVRKQIIAGTNIALYKKTRGEIINNLMGYPGHKYHLICAKQFTLRLLYERFKACFGTKCTYDQFKARLSTAARVDIDDQFKKALLAA